MNLGFFFFFFWSHHVRSSFPDQDQSRTAALEAQNLNHGTTREVRKEDFISNQMDFQA